jgi:hypothetical protein
MSYTNLFTSIKSRVFSHNLLKICTTLLLLLLLSASAASAAIITVDGGGAGYTDVRAVVDVWGCTYPAWAIAGIMGYIV